MYFDPIGTNGRSTDTSCSGVQGGFKGLNLVIVKWNTNIFCPDSAILTNANINTCILYYIRPYKY